jgi:hypothetical protein
MKPWRERRKPSASLVVSVVALVVAMTGTGYAAIKLPAHSIGAKQLKKSSITSLAVKDHSLLRKDFKANQLPKGATGPQGPKGDSGAPGSAVAYAHINQDGSLDAAHSKNVTGAHIGITSASYCMTVTVPVNVGVASVDSGGSGLQGDASVVLAGQDPGGHIPVVCASGGNALVATENGTGTVQGAPFFIVFD